MPFVSSDSWTILSPIEQSIKRKIEAVGTPLREWDIRINYGIKTGCNEAFIIDKTTRDRLITADPRSAEIIRPILRGKDIKRYDYTFANQYLITAHNGYRDDNRNEVPPINIKNYPAIKSHLDEYWDIISARTDKGVTPYNLRNCAYMDDFSKQKIVWGNLNLTPQYALADAGMFVNAPSPMIVPGTPYLLAFLNSVVCDWYFKIIAVERSGGFFEYKPMFIEQLPIPKPTSERVDMLNHLVDVLVSNYSYEVELEINQVVNNIFQLSEEEITYIGNSL